MGKFVVWLRGGTPAAPHFPAALPAAKVIQEFTKSGLTQARRLSEGNNALRPGLEQTLREMADRGDIIRTMHRALAGRPDRAQTDFAIEATPAEPILGRLVERGLHDELTGEAYSVIDAIDGRVHHLRFRDLEATGDTLPGGIVETRLWSPREDGRAVLSLVGRSDLSLEAQLGADGATWLDRLALARTRAPLSHGGFGAEVRAAMERRADHLIAEGLATRTGRGVTF
uniref:DUF3363 domain-containing protein n=1 Tax=Phreatobacter sp. TaxID=1966341 RepID=UPI0025F4FDF7